MGELSTVWRAGSCRLNHNLRNGHTIVSVAGCLRIKSVAQPVQRKATGLTFQKAQKPRAFRSPIVLITHGISPIYISHPRDFTHFYLSPTGFHLYEKSNYHGIFHLEMYSEIAPRSLFHQKKIKKVKFPVGGMHDRQFEPHIT